MSECEKEKVVLVCAHHSSLKAIVRFLEGDYNVERSIDNSNHNKIDDDLYIPPGVPLIYELDMRSLLPLQSNDQDESLLSVSTIYYAGQYVNN